MTSEYPPEYLWAFLLPGYFFSIAIETPVLLVGLSPRHSLGVRIFSGFWLTACTYPVVVLVLPLLLDPDKSRGLYLWVAETFAPVAECALFWLAFGKPLDWRGSGARPTLDAVVTERFDPERPAAIRAAEPDAACSETGIAASPTSGSQEIAAPKVPQSTPLTVSPWSMARDLATITLANLASFGLGELVHLWQA